MRGSDNQGRILMKVDTFDLVTTLVTMERELPVNIIVYALDLES